MSNRTDPTRYVIPEQVHAFRLAVCERLGIDPAIVESSTFEVAGGDVSGRVTLVAHLPADEIIEMFNAASRA